MRYCLSRCKRGTQEKIAQQAKVDPGNLSVVVRKNRGTQEHVRHAIFRALVEQLKEQKIDFPITDYWQFLKFGELIEDQGIPADIALLSWELTHPAPRDMPPPARMVAILGRIPAGRPDQMRENIIGWEPVDESIPGGCYAIRVAGNSMMRPDGEGIMDGDVVFFVEESQPAHNDVVVVNNEFGDSMLKRLKIREDGEYVLTSDNPRYEAVKPNEQYRIVGKVIDVRRQPNWK